MNSGRRVVWPILTALFATGLAEAGSPATALVERRLYAVDQAAGDRGSISVYDIDAGHRLRKTVETVPDVADVKGVAAVAATGSRPAVDRSRWPAALRSDLGGRRRHLHQRRERQYR